MGRDIIFLFKAHSEVRGDILLNLKIELTGEKRVAKEAISAPQNRGSFEALFFVARVFGSISYC